VPKGLAWAFRTGGMYRGNKFAEMVERARVEEALQDGRTARFVVSDGSPLVDLLAWGEADFYSGSFDEKGLQQLLLLISGARRIPLRQWASFLKKAPEVWLLNVFDLAHPPSPDVLVLTTVSPALAWTARERKDARRSHGRTRCSSAGFRRAIGTWPERCGGGASRSSSSTPTTSMSTGRRKTSKPLASAWL
jgi:hypothetical protein